MLIVSVHERTSMNIPTKAEFKILTLVKEQNQLLFNKITST